MAALVLHVSIRMCASTYTYTLTISSQATAESTRRQYRRVGLWLLLVGSGTSRGLKPTERSVLVIDCLGEWQGRLQQDKGEEGEAGEGEGGRG